MTKWWWTDDQLSLYPTSAESWQSLSQLTYFHHRNPNKPSNQPVESGNSLLMIIAKEHPEYLALSDLWWLILARQWILHNISWLTHTHIYIYILYTHIITYIYNYTDVDMLSQWIFHELFMVIPIAMLPRPISSRWWSQCHDGTLYAALTGGGQRGANRKMGCRTIIGWLQPQIALTWLDVVPLRLGLWISS